MPLLLNEHVNADCLFGVWRIDEDENELFSLIPQEFHYEEQINHFTASHRRLEWLAVRALLQQLLPNVEITYNKNGKPYLLSSDFCISISHTKKYACILLYRHREIGVDIEEYADRVEKVVSHFINDTERPLPPNDRNRIWSLLLHWCAKEALYKCIDNDVIDFKSQMTVIPFDFAPTGTFQMMDSSQVPHKLYNMHFRIYNDYALVFTIND